MGHMLLIPQIMANILCMSEWFVVIHVLTDADFIGPNTFGKPWLL
jgi:hypothetical protein